MSKFKIGDKVRIRDGSKICNYACNWTNNMKKYIGSICTINGVEGDLCGVTGYYVKENHYVWDERGLERTEDKSKNQKIVIANDGKTTTAKLYDGKQVIKTVKAKCNPSDEFDFNVGASIALERLTGQILGKVKNTLFDWNGFKAGKFNVVVTRNSIDDFLKECEAHGVNWKNQKATVFNPIKYFDKEVFERELLQLIMDFDSTNKCDFEVVKGKLEYSFKPEIKESTVKYD